MTRKQIEARWGMPFVDLLKSIAANGMTIIDSAQIVGMNRDRLQKIAKVEGIIFERSYRMSGISMRFREPAWQVIASMADKGMTRRDVAAAVGYHYSTFLKHLSDHPEIDPFPSSNKVAGFIADAGGSLSEALKDMAAAGMTINAAAIRIGYACGSGLAQAMRARGIDIEFPKRSKKPPKAPQDKRKWVERGGPKGDDWRIQQRREYLIWKDKNERI